jgi:DNA-binding NtrC family response regulator
MRCISGAAKVLCQTATGRTKMDIKNKRILVVEDQPQLVDHVCRGLRTRGAIVLGPAPSLFYATQLLAARGVDLAILDLWLHGKPVFGLADMLAEKGTPFILGTDGDNDVPPRFVRRPRIKKPYELERLFGLVSSLVENALPSTSQGEARRSGANKSVPAGDSFGCSNRDRLIRATTVAMHRKTDPAR